MKKYSKIILPMLFALPAFFMTGCGDGGDSIGTNNIAYEGTIYSDSVQTISIYGQTSAMGDAAATFSTSIVKDDVTITGDITGKVVDEVTYVDDSHINVKVSGTTSSFSGLVSKDFIRINVAHHGLTSDGSSTCLASVNNPAISCTMVGGSSTYTYAGFALPYGTWASDIATHLSVPTTEQGTVDSADISEDNPLLCTIRVTGIDSSATSDFTLDLDAGATSFNHATTITFKTGTSSLLK
jgi:hypothetical protein